jgi:hypothetical protein
LPALTLSGLSTVSLRRSCVALCAVAVFVLETGIVRAELVPGPDGAWIQIGPPTLREHCGVYDPVRQRLVVFGGFDPGGARSDVWTLSLIGPSQWQNITPTGIKPLARGDASAIYDPVGDRLIVFGGVSGPGVFGDVWALSLSEPVHWTELTPGGGPSPRAVAAAIYDPIGRRMLIFGGANGGTTMTDVWALSLDGSPSWSQIIPSGTPPFVQRQCSATYDPLRRRMIVGQTDVWALSLDATPTWSQISAQYIDPGHRFVYDPGADRLIRYGHAYFTADPAVYTLSLSTPDALWQRINPPGPLGRQYHVMVYDSYQDRLIVYGGWSADWYNDTWSMPLTGTMTWTRLSPSGSVPSSMKSHAAIFDPVDDRLLVYPGDAGGRAWAYGNTSGWEALTPLSGPPPRLTHSAMYDPLRRRLLVFGGSTNFGASFYNDLWSLALDGSPQWTAVPTTGTPPPARGNHTAVYDAARDRMVVFGGDNSSLSFNDTWTLDLAATPPVWAPLTPLGTPPLGRTGHVAVFDPAGDRMIVFGGNQSSPHVISVTNDTWALRFASPPTWTPVTTGGTPPLARMNHAAVLDATRSRMLICGGGSFLPNSFLDVHSLDLVTHRWDLLQPMNAPPGPRPEHTAVFDLVNDRMIVFGGEGSTYYKDLWSLDFTDAVTATTVREFYAIRDRDGAELWWSVSELDDGERLEIERANRATGPWSVITSSVSIEGHYADRDPAARAWATTWYRLVKVERDGRSLSLTQARLERASEVDGLIVEGPSPHRRGGSMEIAYTLARSSWMRLSVYDVAGRRTKVLVEAHRQRGEGRESWNLRDVSAGVYFVLLETSGGRVVSRVVVAG